ncbi:unnamed protein product [Cylindrotheca closterium]|uniref:Uncharacterized protein n=1 Tax=Cylindrotheca closterium TaxID=2856 RepID=A0AAD2G4G8_9STRA|nr:unnamed protein product [Cylindrotheca closterium]
MGRNTPCESNSCLWKFPRQKILREDMCRACKKLDGKTQFHLASHNIAHKGVCHVLHPHLRQATKEDPSNPSENRHQKRNRTWTDRYEAFPSKGAHQMMCNRPDAARKRSRLREQTRPRAKDFFQRVRGETSREERRRSYLKELTRQDSLVVPRNGTSKSSKSKHLKTGLNSSIAALDIAYGKTPESTPDRRRKAEYVVAVCNKHAEVGQKQLREIEEYERRKKRRRLKEGAASNETSTPKPKESPLTLHPDLPVTPPNTTPQETTENGTVVKVRRLQDFGSVSQNVSSRASNNKKRTQSKDEKAAKKRAVRVNAIKEALGQIGMQLIQKLKKEKPSARRPYLLALMGCEGTYGAFTKQDVQEAIGINITADEWTNIKIHAKWPVLE